jgi:hypothetical protein
VNVTNAVNLPAGTYRFTAELTFTSAEGTNAAVLACNGPGLDPVFGFPPLEAEVTGDQTLMPANWTWVATVPAGSYALSCSARVADVAVSPFGLVRFQAEPLSALH